MAIDTNRTSEGVYLPIETAREVWAKATDTSAIMQHVPQISLPGAGRAIDVINGMPEAAWVGETDRKPNGNPELDNKKVVPYKLALIIPFSDEFRRDKNALYSAIVREAPKQLGKKVDETIFDASVTAPGAEFDKLSGATQVSIAENTYANLVDAQGLIATADGDLSAWLMSPNGLSYIYKAVDGNDRPLFLDNAQDGAIGRILGEPVYKAKYAKSAGTPNVVGYAGDWESARWGTVEGIKMSISDEATLNIGGTPVNLWEQNMFAVRLEMEFGFRVLDIDHFVALTDEVTPPAGGGGE